MVDATQTNQKLDVTADELKRIEESLKNEQFRNLFVDYMKEISDPENRKIYEAELAQLEAERGNDVRFIKPEAGYVVKTSFTNSGEKVFINVCTSPEVAEAAATPGSSTGPPAVKGKGQHWSIPYSLTAPRQDVDHANKKCTVYDCVFHPDTYALGQRNAAFDRLLVSTAIEGVERQFNVKLIKKYRIPKMKFKGTLTTTVIRTPTPGFVADPAESSTEFLSAMQAAQKVAPPATSLPPTPQVASSTNSKPPLIQEITPQNSSHSLPTPTSPGTQNKKPATPEYSIVHRGIQSDYQRFTSERERQYGARPDALVVKVQLPGVTSAAAVDLDTTTSRFTLSTKPVLPTLVHGYLLNVQLPFPVRHEEGSAQFIKSRSELVVTLPVVPAPKAVLPEVDAPPSPACSEASDGWIKVRAPGDNVAVLDDDDNEVVGMDQEEAIGTIDDEVDEEGETVQVTGLGVTDTTDVQPPANNDEAEQPADTKAALPVNAQKSLIDTPGPTKPAPDHKPAFQMPTSVQLVNTLMFELD
ncbi:pre-RNA processing PIH1/Nop17-domain-containing protein [Phlyctochytrium arcticum]|nr:pre-RNA processing PIH1/Nop17-domain-containing protein [Phlyctochytrium arcticum]